MEQKKKISWGIVGIIIAILILAASIFFTGIKINANIQDLRREVREEIKTYLRREVISFIYAFRSSSIEDRQITVEDIEKGYKFAEEIFSGIK